MKTIEPKIAAIAEKKLIGQKLSMSLIENRTGELWRSFKPRRKEIQNNLNADLISLQIYPSSYKRMLGSLHLRKLTVLKTFTFLSEAKNQFVNKKFRSDSNMLTNEQLSEIRKLKRGQSVYFDDIKAKGPEGIVRKLSSFSLKIK
jgi:hypothetical protein